MQMEVELEVPGASPQLIRKSVDSILKSNMLCSMSTCNADCTPHINTFFYAYNSSYTMYFLTPPNSQHSANLRSNPKAAVAVFDSHQQSGAELRGLQLFGDCRETVTLDEIQAGYSTYVDRFPQIKEHAPDAATMLRVFESRIYAFRTNSVKVFDEPSLGKEHWFTANIRRR
jgi:nitroimidazol reductase NimA-like FMN-containing flavoprotein (pyridoxamine 5'-phosphate oxidase superfamily)